MSVGIYIHVPFCAKKCPYCDFYSCKYTKKDAELYTRSIIRDIEQFTEKIHADTIYFGGGTPSIIPYELIERMLYTIYDVFDISIPEITIEVNPCTVNAEKLEQYRKIGINRLSVGVQSTNDDELELLGRNHNFRKAKEIIIAAENIGFDNISCDLMIGIPKQTKDNIKHSIGILASLNIQHISSYILKIERGTPFDNSEFIQQMPDDDDTADLYLFMIEELKKYGFLQYEISNFAKIGYESKHNLKYWKCQEYLGFGPAAHSYYNSNRYYCPSNLTEYIKNGSKSIVVDDKSDDDEKIMLGLRLVNGIDLEDFPNKKSKIISKINSFEKNGLVVRRGSRINLTPKGFLVSNSIITELIF